MDFNNTKIAFSMKSNGDLRNARLLFTLIQSPGTVKFIKAITNVALKLHIPVAWAVKPTLYRQFVGGESLEECTKAVELLKNYNVKSVLDFSAEGGSSKEQTETAFAETVDSIDYAAANPAIAYAVFKPTAMVNVNTLSIAARKEPLNKEQKEQMEKFRERIFSLCRHAWERGVRILIDAEHFLTQDIIDQVTEEAMETFNKERAIVFHTLQMYRKDRLQYLKELHERARDKGYIPGIKFVRGAYMDEERKLAAIGGYEDPIHPSKEATDDSYDGGLRYVMENIDSFELFSGTHNYESNYLLAHLIDSKGLKRNDPRIFFSQLYGMSDNISFVLASQGFNVCKYLPYAPVREVLPYLLRRAEENTSMAGQTGRELQLIKDEIARRGKVRP